MIKHAIIILTVLLFVSCDNTPEAVKKAIQAGNGNVVTSSEVYQRTPNDSPVLGKKALTASQLALIDAGLAGAFRDARVSGYALALEPQFYEIMTVPFPCIPSPEQKIPSFYVRADNYDGTEFDQYNPKGKATTDGIGVVLAAEMVLGTGQLGTRASTMYVCTDESVLSDAVRHGAEHVIALHNDYDYYNLTWYHGNGFYHPLLPKREAKGLTAPAPNPSTFIVTPVR